MSETLVPLDETGSVRELVEADIPPADYRMREMAPELLRLIGRDLDAAIRWMLEAADSEILPHCERDYRHAASQLLKAREEVSEAKRLCR